MTQDGLSFLRIVDEGAINCKCGAPFLIVYSSTARQLFNMGSMQQTQLGELFNLLLCRLDFACCWTGTADVRTNHWTFV